MSQCDAAFAEEASDGGGELQESKEVGDGGSILPNNFADLGVRKCELIDEALIPFGLDRKSVV